MGVPMADAVSSTNGDSFVASSDVVNAEASSPAVSCEPICWSPSFTCTAEQSSIDDVLAQLPADAPAGHRAFQMCKLNSSGHAFFRATFSQGNVSANIDSKRTLGSEAVALRMARACFMKADGGASKEEFANFKAELLAIIPAKEGKQGVKTKTPDAKNGAQPDDSQSNKGLKRSNSGTAEVNAEQTAETPKKRAGRPKKTPERMLVDGGEPQAEDDNVNDHANHVTEEVNAGHTAETPKSLPTKRIRAGRVGGAQTKTYEPVLVDGGEPQARTWRICSEKKVSVYQDMAYDSEKIKYLQPEEEFVAEGPYRLNKKGSHTQWLKIVSNKDDAGRQDGDSLAKLCADPGAGDSWVSVCSAKDVEKVVCVLKRQNLTEPNGAVKRAVVEDALVIKPQWLRQIFHRGKRWEIRGGICKKRGRFAFAASGTGMLWGEATLVNCLKVGKFTEEGGLVRYGKANKKVFIGLEENFKKHRIKDLSIVTYPRVFAWVMDDVVIYKTPMPYVHPQGCVKWVHIDASATANAVEDHDAVWESEDEAPAKKRKEQESEHEDSDAGDQSSDEGDNSNSKSKSGSSSSSSSSSSGGDKQEMKTEEKQDTGNAEQKTGTAGKGDSNHNVGAHIAIKTRAQFEAIAGKYDDDDLLACLPPDAAAGHRAFEKCVYKKTESEISGSVDFRAKFPGEANAFQLGVSPAKTFGSVAAALRISRVCYLKGEAGASKDEVFKLRDECITAIQNVKPITQDRIEAKVKADEEPKGRSDEESKKAAKEATLAVEKAADDATPASKKREEEAAAAKAKAKEEAATAKKAADEAAAAAAKKSDEAAAAAKAEAEKEAAAVKKAADEAAAAAAAILAELATVLGDNDVTQRMHKVVSFIQGEPKEQMLKVLLQSLLGPAGSLGNDPGKVLKETKAALVLSSLKEKHSAEIQDLAGQVRKSWHVQFKQNKANS